MRLILWLPVLVVVLLLVLEGNLCPPLLANW
uniref:Uncharacterized protein n=1 Tax=Suricata suricatta TaxID=37032 RepID=A0A673UUF9_SURSU